MRCKARKGELGSRSAMNAEERREEGKGRREIAGK